MRTPSFSIRAAPKRPRLRRRLSPSVLRWALAALLLGAAIGVSAGSSTKAALAIVVLPALAVLFLRPDWLPVVLTATLFCEEVSIGGYTISRLAGPLAIAVLILRLALGGGAEVRLPRKSILVATAAYAIWALASALWTVNFAPSLEEGGTGYALASLALSLAYMFTMATLIDSRRQLKRVLMTIWTMSAVVGLIGFSQFHGAEPRSIGLSGDPNFFAALQVISLPLGAVLAAQASSPRTRRFVLIGLAVTIGSTFTSVSRGGLVGLVAVVLVLLVQPARTFFKTQRRKNAFVVVMAFGAAILIAVTYSALAARTETLSSSGSAGSGRVYLWDAALTGYDEHPVVGLGFGAFSSQSNELLRRTPGVNFRDYKLRPEGQPVHNTYLESLTELGPLGALLFVGLMLATLATLQWAAREALLRRDDLLVASARALQLSLLGFAVTSFFLSAETHRTLWVLLGLSLALTRILARSEGEPETTPPGAGLP